MENEQVIREIATKACREALQDHIEEIAEGIARRMRSSLTGQLSQGVRDRTRELHDGTRRITGAKTQTEALESLLVASASVTPGCGLLILRGVLAGGWSCHGITTQENFRLASLDCSRGLAAKAISSGTSVVAQASELELAFTQRLGMKGPEQVLLIPITLKDRVSAFLMALSQETGDLAALEILVQVAQLALDMQAYRKAAPPQAAAAATQHQTEAHHTAESQVATVPRHEASYSAARVATSYAPPAAVAPVHEVAKPAAAVPVPDEAHEKARRFAKLLVEEIKLYNQTKVSEGRARNDLYSRLHEDIEKSRAAYQKRYGESVRDVDFFTQELIRILADNNRAVMGPGFPE
ncbi:MAG TPA: hypothetical protein VM578_13505 [Candidatus Saccharimonadales bacterium]|nr:hypothetical protein [Candidatus Saccharimonadales bacterium]